MLKKVTAVLTAGLLVIGLSGCGKNQIPEMTDDQIQQMGEFAAINLMKYDANNRSRLVDYTDMLSTPEPEPTPQSTPKEPEEQEPEGMKPVDDTPITAAPGSETESAYTVTDVLELPEGMEIVYMEHGLYDRYPEGEEGGFALSATQGKKLLVIGFSIINATGQDQEVDFLTLGPQFRITVNGDYTRRALVTMLENDMTSFVGTIPNAAAASVVLAIEVDDAEAGNISAMTLDIKNDAKTCTIPLL